MDATFPPQISDWSGLLDTDEKILWQGRPGFGVHFYRRDLPEVLLGLFGTGFSIFWITISLTQAAGATWMFGLPIFVIGFFTLIRRNVIAAVLRRFTFYVLTSRRAIIARTAPIIGKSLSFHPISPVTTLDFNEAGARSDIYFAEKISDFHINHHRFFTPIGFERIDAGREVLALFRQIQREAQ